MRLKDQFTPDEWAGIVQSPMLVGLAVTAADPGGLFGAIREGAAIGRALLEAKAGADGGLPGEIVAALETSEGRGLAQDGVRALLADRPPAEAAAGAVVRLGDIAATVDAKAPAEAGAYKGWLRGIARDVAEAANEGGFLGFGGVRVSEAEQQTLAELDRVLG